MKTKIICILVLTLLITTALPVVGLMNIGQTKKTEPNDPQPSATVTGYFSVPAAAFEPWLYTTEYDNYGHYCRGAGSFVAPVYIPNTATVTKLDFYWSDESASKDAQLYLIRYELGDLAFDFMAEVESFGNSGSGITTDYTIDYPIIDNKLYCYYLRLNMWDESYSIQMRNVNIEYTIVIGSGSGEVIAKNGQTQVIKGPVTPMNEDSFIQRLKRVFTGEIIDVDIADDAAISSSKIDGVPSHDHDERYYTQTEVDALIENLTKVVNGIKPYGDTNYIPGTGYSVTIAVDTGYTLTGALATGYQTDLGGNPSGLLRVETNVNGNNLEFRVYDSAGNEPDDAGWPADTRVQIDYLAILAR